MQNHCSSHLFSFLTTALAKHGALSDLERRGVKYVHTYCVDNALVKVADPSFIGFCIQAGADCANKVVRKDIPNEPVGVMCERGGQVGVIEYSEIPKPLTELRDGKTGQLVYNAGNIANHFFTTDFLKEMAKTHLPYAPVLCCYVLSVCGRTTHIQVLMPAHACRFHIAKKKIPHVGDDGKTVHPDKENGIKLEMFVFDVFPFAKHLVAYLVWRLIGWR